MGDIAEAHMNNFFIYNLVGLVREIMPTPDSTAITVEPAPNEARTVCLCKGSYANISSSF